MLGPSSFKSCLCAADAHMSWCCCRHLATTGQACTPGRIIFLHNCMGGQIESAVQAAANAEVLNDDVHRRLDGSLSFFAAANL